MGRKVLVTGAAGFIGSHMVDSLLSQGISVIGVDNLSTGKKAFLNEALMNPDFELIIADLLTFSEWNNLIKDVTRIYHFAANADIRFGIKFPTKDFDQNITVTKNILELARKFGISEIIFPSTGSVYGRTSVIPTPEDAPFPIQTSLYAASKLASEAMIQAYSETFGIQSWIFRFVSILGPRYSHGHVFDFYSKLSANPNILNVLGNGKQKKSYLHVHDCISAINFATEYPSFGTQTYNLGTDEYCTVIDSIKWITEDLKIKPKLILGSEPMGWIGDNPFIYLDTKKIKNLGWLPQKSIKDSIKETLKYLIENPWLFAAAYKS